MLHGIAEMTSSCSRLVRKIYENGTGSVTAWGRKMVRKEVKMCRNCMMRRRKVKETAASLIGSRASTLFLGLKYTY